MNSDRTCTSCRHYHFLLGAGYDGCRDDISVCRRNQTKIRKNVDGSVEYTGKWLKCSTERDEDFSISEKLLGQRIKIWGNRDICGRDGKYWEERQKTK